MTDKPFPEALTELLAEREWSIRELGKATRLGGKKGLAHSSINQMMRGLFPPTREAIEKIAGALQVRPEHFAEYRLEVVRDSLNWRTLGVKQALRNLEAMK